MDVGKSSGSYVGNGTTQDIEFSRDWVKLDIVRADLTFKMTFFKGSGTTVGGMAVGSGGQYRKMLVDEGGVIELENGFSVGDHLSLNAEGHTYYWTVK